MVQLPINQEKVFILSFFLIQEAVFLQTTDAMNHHTQDTRSQALTQEGLIQDLHKIRRKKQQQLANIKDYQANLQLSKKKTKRKTRKS